MKPHIMRAITEKQKEYGKENKKTIALCCLVFFVGKWKAFIMATNQLPAQQWALEQAALPNNIAFPSISSKKLLQCRERVRNHTGNLPAGRTILAGAPQKLLAQKH